MLIIKIAAGVFIGQMARACLLGYIEYSRQKKYCREQNYSVSGGSLLDNIRLVM